MERVVPFVNISVSEDDLRIGIVGQVFIGEQGSGSVSDALKVTKDLLPVSSTVWLALSIAFRGKRFVPVTQIPVGDSDGCVISVDTKMIKSKFQRLSSGSGHAENEDFHFLIFRPKRDWPAVNESGHVCRSCR